MKSIKTLFLSLPLSLLLLASCGEGQKELKADAQHFLIKGQVTNAPDSMLILVARFKPGQQNPDVDSIRVFKGAFEYAATGDSAKLENLVLAFENSYAKQAAMGAEINPSLINMTLLVRNNETFEISGDAEKVKDMKVTGSKLAQDVGGYLRVADSTQNMVLSISDSLYAAAQGKEPAPDAIKQVTDRISAIQNGMILEFIREHNNSELSLFIIGNDLLNQVQGPLVIETAYNSLSPELKNTADGKRLGEVVAKMRAIAIGETAPDFQAMDINGKPFQFSSTRGKYILLDFWASWCKPCRMENPNLVKAYAKYKNKGFEIVGFSVDQEEMAWKDAVAKDKLSWTHVSRSDAPDTYFVRGIPTNFLLDPQGKIIATNLRGNELENKLAAILQ